MSLKSNIPKLYVIKVFRWLLFVMPIITLFFQENGLSMSQVFTLQAIFSISIVLFEIPSGYFADVLGRKYSIIIGTILAAVGHSVYTFSYGFYGFLIGELILGLGSSFVSGADSALIYDTLLDLKKSKEYKRIQGFYSSLANFSEGVAGILGGFLALISLRTTFYVQAVFYLLAIPLAFSLVEPKRHKKGKRENPFKEILKIVKYSIHDHAEVKWLIFYSGVIGASTLSFVWFIQPYLKSIGIPLFAFGIIWAIYQFSTGFFSIYAHKFESFIGRRNSLILLVILSGVAYFLVSYLDNYFGAVAILLFYLIRGFNTPILKDYVNKIIPSNIRATVLSVKHLAVRLLFSLLGPIFGKVSDIFSMPFAFTVAGVTFMCLGSICLIGLHKNKVL